MSQKVYNFTTASDYNYDATKIEFVNGIARLKDLTPIKETFYANYNTDINGSRGLGDLTGTPRNGASVSGGKLDLAHNDLRYVDYDAHLNADSQQTGCFRFKVTPNYNGADVSEQVFFCNTTAPRLGENLIYIRHRAGSSEGGYLVLHMYDFQRNLIKEAILLYWTAVQGQEYEFELNYDLTNGETRFFLDGIQQGVTITETGVRDSNIRLLRIGSGHYPTIPSQVSNFKIDDFQVFSTVQHTENYTPESIPENTYSLDKPTVYPKLSWNPTSPLTMLSFTETLGVGNEGSIGYQISQDAGVTWKYWDGSAFVVATSEQYNDAAILNSVFSNLTLIAPFDDLITKSILISNGEQKVELDRMVIEILDSINDLIVSVDFPRQVVKGDTFNIKCQVNQSIFDWQIRASILDNSGHLIKLANTLSGGGDSEIDIIDQINGMFFIKVAKDLTTNFDDKARVEIEIENSAEKIYTIWKYNFEFKKEEITWETP